MGRQKEFKVGKSFTFGLQELAWLAKHCHDKKIKGSEFMNKLLREAMTEDKVEKVKESNTQVVHCMTCNDWEPHGVLDMICTGCNQVNQLLKERVEEKKKTLQA